jgi:hypothetical protein
MRNSEPLSDFNSRRTGVEMAFPLSNQCNAEVKSLSGSLRVGLKKLYAALNDFDLE